MNYLITGGAGNIGSYLAAKLASNQDNFVVVVDNLSTGDISKVPQKENVKFIKCDVNDYTDVAPVFGRYNFDYVFHYAAVVGVKRTLENPLMVLNDINGIKNILNLCKNTGVKRVFYSSSSEVYGEPFEIPQREQTTPLNSRLPYAIVKNLGEAFCRSYFQEFGLEFTIFRFFNTYGPHQSEDFVIPKFLKRAISGEDIFIYGDGSQTRSFCYIDDNIDTCIKAISDPEAINEVINVGSDIEISVLELAQKIVKLTGDKSKIIHKAPLPEGDMSSAVPKFPK
ncbi:NAD-dependent epimerase/dehydratase family protein [Algoriphagus boritolerans]|uniref:NAD-dependent epimerase/dehydratase family protein n=1 Tax=Algoriphagus boritolerans TaxID=308111 RepID=UPI000A985D1D